jgi:hypothetical protein
VKELDDLELHGDDEDVPMDGAPDEESPDSGPSEIETREEGDELPPDLLPERPSIPLLVPLLVLVLGVPIGLYLAFRPRAEDVGVVAPTPAPASLPAQPDATPEPAAPLELPALGESDTAVRELAASLSPRAAFRRWLESADLVRRFVATVENVADGENPRGHLPFLAPEGGFRASGGGASTHIDPASYARYDVFALTVQSLDAAAAVGLYRGLKPLIEDACRELGHPDGGFDETLGRAIGKLLAVPVVQGPVRLTRLSAAYGFADPRLQSLEPAQKQLLRTGPENTKRVQDKLRELSAALEAPSGQAAEAAPTPGIGQ